ncbi:hypothetical protein CEE37_14460 [candidate division LCP-89 bacterium B3_LCP]|uniref:ABC transmembrane type-1 domain-containing protein n=1 Tax=candidate division LCP-89 bacterium B3_LCP TaxID=2012998 RepID=A0A532UPQ4_UNCL8|nr:MAG: hypothetical protein CEE37_14460 [candidate division LCP-89 bacterium B3_LCP]
MKLFTDFVITALKTFSNLFVRVIIFLLILVMWYIVMPSNQEYIKDIPPVIETMIDTEEGWKLLFYAPDLKPLFPTYKPFYYLLLDAHKRRVDREETFIAEGKLSPNQKFKGNKLRPYLLVTLKLVVPALILSYLLSLSISFLLGWWNINRLTGIARISILLISSIPSVALARWVFTMSSFGTRYILAVVILAVTNMVLFLLFEFTNRSVSEELATDYLRRFKVNEMKPSSSLFVIRFQEFRIILRAIVIKTLTTLKGQFVLMLSLSLIIENLFALEGLATFAWQGIADPRHFHVLIWVVFISFLLIWIFELLLAWTMRVLNPPLLSRQLDEARKGNGNQFEFPLASVGEQVKTKINFNLLRGNLHRLSHFYSTFWFGCSQNIKLRIKNLVKLKIEHLINPRHVILSLWSLLLLFGILQSYFGWVPLRFDLGIFAYGEKYPIFSYTLSGFRSYLVPLFICEVTALVILILTGFILFMGIMHTAKTWRLLAKLINQLFTTFSSIPILIFIPIALSAISRLIPNDHGIEEPNPHYQIYIFLLMGILLSPVMVENFKALMNILSQREFLSARRASGFSMTRIYFIDVFLRNYIRARYFIDACYLAAMAFLFEVIISFLGRGQAVITNWGHLIHLESDKPLSWAYLFPMFIIILNIAGLRMVSLTFEDRFIHKYGTK